MWRISAAALLSGVSGQMIVVDRIAVIAGQHAIKASDIDRELRLTSFINRQQIDFSPAAKRKAADRLVDQQMIREELAAQGYARATDADAEALEKQITADRFRGSVSALNAVLLRYGLTERQLRGQLLWQLTVLKFIDQRFRPGVLVTDDEMHSYYESHEAELKKQNPKKASFAALAPSIRASLEGEQINRQFEEWLDETRKRTRVEYREAAFQ